MRKDKHFVSWKVIVSSEIVLGLLLMIGTFFLACNSDLEKAEQKLRVTTSYMKKQCNDSVIRDMASEAKSLLRVTESVEQIRWRLKNDKEFSEIDNRAMKTCAEDSYLDGLILLDKKGNVKKSYDSSGLGSDKVLDKVDRDTIMDTLSFEEKTYAVRITLEDDSHLDIASVSRADNSGVLVGYYYTSAEYVSVVNNSIRAIVSGFQIETTGTIAVSVGDQVIISNDESLEETRVEDTPILNKIMGRGGIKQLTHCTDGKSAWGNYFGLMEKSRDYYIYVYLSEREVFSSTFPNVISVLLIYLLILVVANMMMWVIQKNYQKEKFVVRQEYMKTLETKNIQLEEALDRMEKASAAKSSFLSRMSHDIRTPLNGIIGLLKIDQEHFEETQLVKENHKKMQVSANHLLSLINDVLQMSKLEDGSVVLTHEVINLGELTRDIVTIIQGRAMEAGVVWDYEKGKSVIPYPYIYGSPVHLRQIFLNIYGNCIKYTQYGGKITTIVDTLDEKDGICTYRWKITDTGIGMSKEFISHIFEPFAQEKQDARSVYQGTGLGMAIVKSLIDQMGGTIEVSSEVGEGSTFIVIIPFEIADKPEPVIEAFSEAEYSIDGLHLLLVEDNELNAEIAQTLLEDEGAEVTLVQNGEQAVETFFEKPQGTFDAILMDVMMPVMDGLTATKTIRTMERQDADTIPIIAMTANAFKEDAEKCMAAGMNAHLAKPLEIDKVVRAIVNCTGHQRTTPDIKEES